MMPPEPPLRCSLLVVPVAVRDVQIPLGGFANVQCSHSTPRVPGQMRKKVRTAPPVLLPKGGEASLPGTGSTCSFSCRPDAVLPILSAEPILFELWHHDKYTKDVLLGVATVDPAEVLSTRPAFEGPRTVHQQEQTVAVISPTEGMLPAALARGARGGHPVAFLEVRIRIDMMPPEPPPPPKDVPAAAAPVVPAPRVRSDDDASSPGGALRTRSGRPADMHAKLQAWERKEKQRFAASLAQKEEERLQLLEREWKVRERKRDQLLRQQARAMASAAKDLQHKLSELAHQEASLHSTAEQLALKEAALEGQVEIERTVLVAAAEQEASALRADAEGARAQLQEASDVSEELKRWAEALGDKHARAETEAAVWREAHAALSARAMSLEADKGKLLSALESERVRAATLAEAHKRMQRKRQDDRDAEQRAAAAAAAAAAELPNRLERIKADAAGIPRLAAPLTRGAPLHVTPPGVGLPPPPRLEGSGYAGGAAAAQAVAATEAELVQRRLQEHSAELREEARELEEFRELLLSRDELRREVQGQKAEAARARAKEAELQRGSPGGGGGGPAGSSGGASAAVGPAAGLAGGATGTGGGGGTGPAYRLSSLVEGLRDEESWWDTYSREVLQPET